MDYAAIAKQFGGTTITNSKVDYNAMAKQFGGTQQQQQQPSQDSGGNIWVSNTHPTQDQQFRQSLNSRPDTSGNIWEKAYNSIGNAFKGGISQAKEGYNQARTASNPLELLEGGTKLAAGAFNTAFSPLAPVTEPIGQGINAVANKISDIPAVQKFAQTPLGQGVARGAEDVGNLSTIAQGVAGFKGGAEVAPKVGEVIGDTASKVRENISTKLENRTFQNSLKDAQETIYPKLTQKEKANVQLKDTGGLMNKSVPDLINDHQTKPIIESVSNLPYDIKVKPSNSLVQNENNLNQGINRLHQDTDSYLYTKKMETPFTQATFQSYMKDKVIKSVASEYGAKSIQTKATIDAIKTAYKLIEAKDAHGVYTARQAFQKAMTDKFPNAFKKSGLNLSLDPVASAKVEAMRTVRTSLNDFVSEKLLKENDPYRPRLKEESNLIRAVDEMRKRNTDQLGKNPVQRVIDRNPKVKAGVNMIKKVLPFGIATHL